MSGPERVQLRRTKGWRIPENTVVVARPTRWGNPHTVNAVLAEIRSGALASSLTPRALCVELFRSDLHAAINEPWTAPHTIEFRTIAESLTELRGHNLACWCPLDQPCHADVLLELANSVATGPIDEWGEAFTTGTGQVLRVHRWEDCIVTPCTIHAPSDHHMRSMPLHWRDDRRIFERICEHGVGHPDPDGSDPHGGVVHGCDGCCSSEAAAWIWQGYGP